MILWLFAIFLIGVPICFSLGFVSLGGVLLNGFPPLVVVQRMFTGADSIALIAIPLFMLAGELMFQGGMSKRMVDFADTLLGHFPSGLAMVNILACMFFAAITGSAIAATAAIGGMMIPEMKKRGYDPSYAATLVCFGGTVGPIIPPSLSFVLYGATTKTSVPDLFKAGILPGIIIGLTFLVVNIIICKRTGTDLPVRSDEKKPLKEALVARLKRLGKATKDGFWALLSPVIILGGIYSGIFTPTEAAAVSVVYSVIVSIFVYKDMDWKSLYETLVGAAVLNGATSFLLGYSTVFSTFMTFEQVPQAITTFLSNVSDNPAVVLLVINAILLVIGCFLDTVPAIIIMAPMLLPTLQTFGINPIHFAVVMAVNLAFGLCTPPYGCNLFVGAAVAKIKMESMFKWIVPFFLVSIVLLMILTYIPSLSLMFV